jgi:hypothetical protein
MIALLCVALAAASPGARAAAALVPARAEAALLLENADAGAGLRALFDAVAQRAPALSVRHQVSALVGPDVFGEPLAWGLSPAGPRALVLARGTLALSAPVRDGKAARIALQKWLEQSGPPRLVRTPPLNGGPLASGAGKKERAGMVTPVAGTLRLLTASGMRATALVTSLAQIGARKSGTPALGSDRDLREALARLSGPAGLVVRAADPLRGAAFALAASERGLDAKGLVIASSPVLAGEAPGPAACEAASLLCFRAGIAQAGRSLLAQGARLYLSALLAPPALTGADGLAQKACAAADKVVLRSDGVDFAILSEAQPAWTVHLSGAASPPPAEPATETAHGPRSLCVKSDAELSWFGTPCPEQPPADPRAPGGQAALEARLDTAVLDAALAKLTPVDALRGSAQAELYAARLLVGGLLRRSGPLQITGQPHKAGAGIELHWPLH